MIVTDFPDKAARTKTESDVSFEQLCEQIINAPAVAYKADLRWLKLGAYGDHVDNPETGCLRTNSNLRAVFGVEADYDLEEMTLDEAAELFRVRGVRAFLYTTATHSPDKPRFRALVPFSKQYPPEARDTYTARVNGILGGVISEESFNRSQAFYAGRVAGVVFDYRVVDGRYIDEVDGLPEIGRPGGDASGATGYTVEAAFDDIRSGAVLHGPLNYLAMRGVPRDEILAVLNESDAKTDDPVRLAKRVAEVDRSIRGAERRRTRDREKMLAKMTPPPRETTRSEPRGPLFETVTAASLADKPIPPQRWLARDLIPAGQPVLLSGDGGLGKSLLALQLAVAVSGGGMWLGQFIAEGPVIYLSAEDEIGEIHRRLARMTSTLSELTNLHVAPMAELDALLVTPAERGRLNTTPLYDAVAARVEEIQPALVVLDSNADFFGGNEMVRAEVRWFIGQLRKLCHRTGCTVLILSHPSVAGMATGTGNSGSTHWNNSVRARLYLTRPGGEKTDQDERRLEVMKNNRGPLGKQITLRWRAGVFVADDTGPTVEPTEADVDDFFVSMVATYNKRGINVSTANGATNAPKVFAEQSTARARGFTKKMLGAAMMRAIDSGRVVNISHRGGADARKHLEVARTEAE